MRMAWRIFLMAALAVLPALAPEHATAQDKPVLVFAAASLKNALDDISAQYQHDTGKSASISYAASSALAKQIEAGAPADIFISADLDWMDYLEKRNLIRPQTRVDLLRNTIVLIAPAATAPPAGDGDIGALILQGLGGDGRLAMADPAAVPAGKYGKAAL